MDVAPPKSVKKASEKPQQPFRCWRSHKLSQKPPLTITGYSRAADKTFLHIPEWKIGLDAGVVNGRQPEVVLLTHTHIDHSKDLGYICQRDQGVTIYCPKASVGYIDKFTRAEVDLNNCGPWYEDAPWYKYKLEGVVGGNTFTLKNDTLLVTVIDCIHAVPCVGYAISEKRTKLKEEYAKLSGKEIGALKKTGVEVSHTFHAPIFVYLGDTSVGVFEKNPFVLTYPTVIVECTFIHQEAGIHERALRDGHMHWDSLQPIVLANPQTTFILIHFSLRYKEAEIHQFFDNLVNRAEDPLNLDNVVLFVGESTGGSQF